MNKKDYILIAAVVNKATQYEDYVSKDVLLDELVAALKQDNPRFDADKFLAACGEE